MTAQAHYLVNVSRNPRVVAYLLIALMVASPVLFSSDTSGAVPLAQTLMALAALCYPWLVHALLRRFLNSSRGARTVLPLDAIWFGAVCGLAGNNPYVLCALATMLGVGAMIIAPVRWLPWLVGLFVAANLLAWAAPFEFTGMAAAQVIALAATGLFATYIGYLVFRETVSRVNENRNVSARLTDMTDLSDHLSKFVAPEVAEQRSDQIRRKPLTVFFSDISGFTRMMEEMDEDAAAALLNNYFDVMTGIARTHGGTVDKFIGDGMLVFFGDPETKGETRDAMRCLQMALAMRDAATELGRSAGREFVIRIGIHSGQCLVGGFGNRAPRDYTVIGNVVNLASRIEGCAAGGEVLMSEACHRLVAQAVAATDLGAIKVKGLRNPVRLYRLDGFRDANVARQVRGKPAPRALRHMEREPVREPVRA